jgi:hypothetical protein
MGTGEAEAAAWVEGILEEVYDTFRSRQGLTRPDDQPARAGAPPRRRPPRRARVVGFLSIADDVTTELAREVIESVQVRGIFRASRALKEALADRTT